MSDMQNPPGGPSGDHGNTGWVVLGAALVALGFLLGARNLDLVPWPMTVIWETLVKARGGIGVILVGVLLIVWARSGRTFTAPPRGKKLYRAREDKWIAGVLGGVAEYFTIDVTFLRIAFLALVVLFDVGALVVAYIIMAIIVPLEPAVPAVTAAPAPSAPAEPPADAPQA